MSYSVVRAMIGELSLLFKKLRVTIPFKSWDKKTTRKAPWHKRNIRIDVQDEEELDS